MLASNPASILNQNPADLGIQNRFNPNESDSSCSEGTKVADLTCATHRGALYKLSIALRTSTLTDEQRLTFYQRAAVHEAVARIPNLLSFSKHGFDETQENFKEPETLDEALTRQIGLCGAHVDLFNEIMRRLSIASRPVQFWWTDDRGIPLNHVAAEAFWDGGWHLYDISMSAYFARPGATLPLSAADARRGAIEIRMVNLKTGFAISPNGDFDYLLRHNVSMTVDGIGEIVLPVEQHGHSFSARFKDIQSYVGDNRVDGRVTPGTAFKINIPDGTYFAKAEVAFGGCYKSRLTFDERTIEPSDGVHIFQITNLKMISIQGPDDACYAVFKSLEFEPSGRHRAGSP